MRNCVIWSKHGCQLPLSQARRAPNSSLRAATKADPAPNAGPSFSALHDGAPSNISWEIRESHCSAPTNVWNQPLTAKGAGCNIATDSSSIGIITFNPRHERALHAMHSDIVWTLLASVWLDRSRSA